MSAPTKPITISEVEAEVLILEFGGNEYLWGPGETSSCRPGPVKIYDINMSWGSGRWFMFWVADTYDPAGYAIQHDSFENAYEEFCDWKEDMLKIEEPDLKDYMEDPENPTCSFSSKGVPIDTESIQGREVKLVFAGSAKMYAELQRLRTLRDSAVYFAKSVAKFNETNEQPQH